MLTLFNDITTAQQEQIQGEFLPRVEEAVQRKALNLAHDYLNARNVNTRQEEQPQPQEEEEEESTFNFGEQEHSETKTRTKPMQPTTPAAKNVAKLESVQSNGSLKGAFNFEFPMSEVVEKAVAQEFPEIAAAMLEDINKKIQDAAKLLKPNLIMINDIKVGEVKGELHKDFKESLQTLTATGNLWLTGYTGTGKSYLAKQIAEGLGLPFGEIALTAGMSEGYLTGRMLIDGTFFSTEFIDVYENGGVMLLDECDAADSNTMLVINGALSSNRLNIPNRKGNNFATKHKDFYVIAAANTWGTGNESDYHGREYQDAAFLNRFSCSKMFIDYDLKLEKEILKDAPELCETLQQMRKNVINNNLERSVSTRTLIDAMKLNLSGFTIPQIVRKIQIDWTQEERNKA